MQQRGKVKRLKVCKRHSAQERATNGDAHAPQVLYKLALRGGLACTALLGAELGADRPG